MDGAVKFTLRCFSYHLMKQLRSCKNQRNCWKKNFKSLKDIIFKGLEATDNIGAMLTEFTLN